MPTYEFKCTYCGETHDVIRKIVERDAPEICAKCGEVCHRTLPAPRGRVLGDSYNEKHDIMNRATADLAGIPYSELPPGLKT